MGKNANQQKKQIPIHLSHHTALETRNPLGKTGACFLGVQDERQRENKRPINK